jgi:hypothetical protein
MCMTRNRRTIGRSAAAAAALLVMGACGTSPTGPSGDPRVSLQLGQTATVGPERTALTFERVAYDQRCPWNAACLAFADSHALLVFRVGGNRSPGNEERLRAGGLTPGHLHVPGAVLTVAELKPDPWSPFDWPASDYRVTFDVVAD